MTNRTYTKRELDTACRAILERAASDLDADRKAQVWVNPVNPSYVLKRSAMRIRAMKRRINGE